MQPGERLVGKKARILGWDGNDFWVEIDGREVCFKDARITKYEPGKIEGDGIEVIDLKFEEFEK